MHTPAQQQRRRRPICISIYNMMNAKALLQLMNANCRFRVEFGQCAASLSCSLARLHLSTQTHRNAHAHCLMHQYTAVTCTPIRIRNALETKTNKNSFSFHRNSPSRSTKHFRICFFFACKNWNLTIFLRQSKSIVTIWLKYLLSIWTILHFRIYVSEFRTKCD